MIQSIHRGRAATSVLVATTLAIAGCRGSGARVEDPAREFGDGGKEPTGRHPEGCSNRLARGDAPLIDDFAADGLLPPNDGRAGRWFFYDDGTGGRQTVEFADETLHLESQGFKDWGSGFGVTLSPDATPSRACAYDASIHGGLTFRARGRGRIRLRIAMPETMRVAEGGQCALPGEECYDWPGAWLSLGTDWKSYTLPFCYLQPENWFGAALPLDPSRISGIHFMVESDAELFLDDLAFTARSSDAGASCAGPCPLELAPAETYTPTTSWLALSDSLSLHTFEQETVRCGAIERRYLSYVPAALGAESDAPVVLALHGSGTNAETFQETMARGGLDALAERDGFVVIYGNAAPGAQSRVELPNSGAWRQSSFDDGELDDVAYLDAVLRDLERRGVLSGKNPLFLMGLSNGGGMVLETAKRWPDRVVGIAPFMAFDGFDPSPIPDLDASPLRRVIFGYAPGDPGLPPGYVNDVLASLPLDWARALELPSDVIASPEVEELPDLVVEGEDYTGSAGAALATRDSRATRHDYGSPGDARRVRVLVFADAGHFWPHPEADETWLVERWGFRNQDVDASEAVWEFFREALTAP